MFTMRIQFSALCFLALVQAGGAKAQDAQQQAAAVKPQTQPVQPARQTLPLRIVNKEQFCGRLSQTFANFGAANGYNQVQTAMMANGATAQVVQEIGRAHV